MALSQGDAHFTHHDVHHVFIVIARDDVAASACARSRGGRPRHRRWVQRGREGGESARGKQSRGGRWRCLWRRSDRRRPLRRGRGGGEGGLVPSCDRSKSKKQFHWLLSETEPGQHPGDFLFSVARKLERLRRDAPRLSQRDGPKRL